MPADDSTRRRHVLLVDVTQAASEVSRLSTKPAISTCRWSPVSARAATAWSAGPCSWRSCCPNPGVRPATGPRHPAGAGWRGGPMLRQRRHDGYVSEVDDDQLAALRRLRVAFGFVEVVEVISHDPAAAPDESQEAGMADPGRMTPEERKQAYALLTRALSDPNWRTASQALDDLMRKLLVVHRLLEAEECLAKRKPSAEPT
jgi:hypothetical protein